MKSIIGVTRRGAAPTYAIAPIGACAQPVDQAATAIQSSKTAAAGPTRQIFLKRHAAKLLTRDADGDGRVRFAELTGAGGNGKLGKRFARIDRNAEGLLEMTEFDAMLSRRFTRPYRIGDGMLSAEERAAARTEGKAADGGSES